MSNLKELYTKHTIRELEDIISLAEAEIDKRTKKGGETSKEEFEEERVEEKRYKIFPRLKFQNLSKPIYTTQAKSFKHAVIEAKLLGLSLQYADLRDSDLRGVDLSYRDLTGADLSNCDLRGVNFTGAILRNVDFSFSNLAESNLRNAQLCHSDLWEAVLEDANLKGCDLHFAKAAHSNLEDAKTHTREEVKNTGNPWGVINLYRKDMSEKVREMYDKWNENSFFQNDLAVIKQLEEELNIEIPKVDSITRQDVGYHMNENGELVKLIINQCKVEDKHLEVIKELTNLTRLYLGENQIQDISPLKELTNLTELDLRSNYIQDISPLRGLTKLTYLRLWGNYRIQDISPLQGLTKLTTLSLEKNSIQDISPLRGLTNLECLNLASNKIIDATPLRQLILQRRLKRYGDSKPGVVFRRGFNIMDNPLIVIPKELLEELEVQVDDLEDKLDDASSAMFGM